MVIKTNSDGGARGNPGPGAIGIVVRDNNKILTMFSKKIGDFVTNNMAEYEALIKALELAKPLTKEVECYLDSELVVKQLLGQYKVKNPRLFELFIKVQKLENHFEKIKYVCVRREEDFQQLADGLVNHEFDNK